MKITIDNGDGNPSVIDGIVSFALTCGRQGFTPAGPVVGFETRCWCPSDSGSHGALIGAMHAGSLMIEDTRRHFAECELAAKEAAVLDGPPAE